MVATGETIERLLQKPGDHGTRWMMRVGSVTNPKRTTTTSNYYNIDANSYDDGGGGRLTTARTNCKEKENISK